MTGRELVDLVLLLLNDSGRGLRTTSRNFQTDSVAYQLSIEQAVVAQQLMPAPFGEHPTGAHLTLSNLIATADGDGGIVGVAQPDDFWYLICGTTDEGKYIQAERPKIGEAFRLMQGNRIWARGGSFYGTADTAVYYKHPPKIEYTGAHLLTFPDAFYHTIKYAAARDLLAQEGRDAADRMQQYHEEFVKSVSSLQ